MSIQRSLVRPLWQPAKGHWMQLNFKRAREIKIKVLPPVQNELGREIFSGLISVDETESFKVGEELVLVEKSELEELKDRVILYHAKLMQMGKL